jgi:hypothetical protein
LSLKKVEDGAARIAYSAKIIVQKLKRKIQITQKINTEEID